MHPLVEWWAGGSKIKKLSPQEKARSLNTPPEPFGPLEAGKKTHGNISADAHRDNKGENRP